MRRAEDHEHGIVRVALGDVGRPLLPLGVQLREVVDDVDGLVPAQDLGPPRGRARAALQHRHERLAPVERGVERREVGDLQRDHDQAGESGEHVDGRRRGLAGPGEAEREERRARLLERRQKRHVLDRVEDQRVAEQERRDPGHEQRQQRDGALEDEDVVLLVVVVEPVGDQQEQSPDRPPDVRRDPRRQAARDHQRVEHPDPRADHGGDPDDATGPPRRFRHQLHPVVVIAGILGA
jgi:hypothetical protein